MGNQFLSFLLATFCVYFCVQKTVGHLDLGNQKDRKRNKGWSHFGSQNALGNPLLSFVLAIFCVCFSTQKALGHPLFSFFFANSCIYFCVQKALGHRDLGNPRDRTKKDFRYLWSVTFGANPRGDTVSSLCRFQHTDRTPNTGWSHFRVSL